MLAFSSPRRPGSAAGAILLSSLVLLVSCSGGDDGPGASGNPANTALAADFGAGELSGTRPFSVQFSDATSGEVTAWLWDFGDGTTSTERNPAHNYVNAGLYDVSLSVTGPLGSSTKVRSEFVAVIAPPSDLGFEAQLVGTAPAAPWETFFGNGGFVGLGLRSVVSGGDGLMPTQGELWADLGAESTSTTSPPAQGPGATPRTGAGIAQVFTYPAGASVLQLDVVFVCAEQPSNVIFNDWMAVDISDGQSSVALLRRDTFSSMANFSALVPGATLTMLEIVTADLEELFPLADPFTEFTLTVQVGNGGDDAVPSRVFVDNLRFEARAPALAVGFTSDVLQTPVNTAVSFTDETLGGASAWTWDFGDRTGANTQNPSHVYTQEGLHTVTLRATAPGAAGEHVKLDYIEVLPPPPIVSIVANPTRGPFPLGVSFSFVNTGGPTFKAIWDFGDPGGSGPNIVVGDTAFHVFEFPGIYTVELTALGSATAAATLDISVTSPTGPNADFAVSASNVDANVPITLTNSSTGTVTSWLWDFGDGTTSTLQNPPPKVYRPTNSQIPSGQSSVQFTIRLTAFGPTGQNSVTTPVTVNVLRFSALFSPTNVFASCTGCHGASGGCTLTPEQTAFDELTIEAATLTCTPGQPRAIPYNSPGSNLFQKVTNPVCGGAVMGGPVNGTLSNAERDQIKRWIETGALR